MSNSQTIATAGNILPSALATLRKLGYVVTLADNERLCKAEKGLLTFVAENVLLLLGLVKLYEVKGSSWRPSDSEVDDYLAFDKASDEETPERVDVWEDSGAVHVICVDAFGDPVELGEVEAREFLNRINTAILKAGGK